MPVSGVDESVPKVAETALGRVSWIEARPASALAEDAVPLVLIHGFTGHRDDFIGVMSEIAELGQGRRVVVPDLRGHGNSDNKPGGLGWSFDQLVNDLVAFLDHLGLDRVDLLGHSMGGFVVLRFALAHPERVRSLILLCTGPEAAETLPKEAFLKGATIAEDRGIDGFQQLLEHVGRSDMSPRIANWAERYWNHHRRRLGAMTPASYRGLGAALFDSESLVPRLREIDLPTLVLVGEFDEDWLSGAELFEQNLARVHRVTLPNAEHHPHIENKQAFLAALESHFEAVETSRRRDLTVATPTLENQE